MSDCLINIRILFWHFQLKTSHKVRVSFNGWHWRKRNRLKAVLKPVEIYEWDFSRWNDLDDSENKESP